MSAFLRVVSAATRTQSTQSTQSRWLKLCLGLLVLQSTVDCAYSASSALAGLQVPCFAPQGLPLLPSSQNTKLPQCTQVIPYINSLIQSSVFMRVEAYYHGCDVISNSGSQGGSGAPTPAPSSSSTPKPSTCASVATQYQNICLNSAATFPGTPCDAFASADFQIFGIPSGCAAETASNHVGASCGAFMTLAASMNSSPTANPSPPRACKVSGIVPPGGVQTEDSMMLGMMIHSLAYNLNRVMGEIATGALNLTNPVAIAMALGSGSYGNAVSSIEGQVPTMTLQLQGQVNISDLLICTGISQPNNLIKATGLFISGCQTNSFYQSLLATYSQIAVIETYYRAYLAYQEFATAPVSYQQLAIQSLQFTESTCTASQAQSQYEKQFPVVIQEQANAQWQ